MKHKIVIYNHDNLVIYEGKALDMPIKMDAIRKKSFELFKDPDPCIIHQSYAIQKFVTPLIAELNKNEKVHMHTLISDTSWIDLPNIEDCFIMLKG
ncbi:MAG: hypothetical protein RBQ71_00840 [Acholeplasmataceae bacterium]|nr:hypothetical protein [Acholeplasmataceae bacterium]